jgi:hypothetical protein
LAWSPESARLEIVALQSASPAYLSLTGDPSAAAFPVSALPVTSSSTCDHLSMQQFVPRCLENQEGENVVVAHVESLKALNIAIASNKRHPDPFRGSTRFWKPK